MCSYYFKSLVPDESVCLMELTKQHEFSLIHFYLVKRPYLIMCLPYFLTTECDDPDVNSEILVEEY